MAPSADNSDGESLQEMEAPLGDTAASSGQKTYGTSPNAIDDILYTDIGINVLLTRLKQSIASARDFAAFLKKRSGLEEDHAQGLKKLAKSTFEAIRRPDSRQGTYAMQFIEVSRAHERMAEHGQQFALQLQQMHDDLTEMSNNMEKGRKHWKQEGTNNEKKVKDAEGHMEKAKSRYDSLAEDYDRVRTGDKTRGGFGLKGPKSAEQREDELQRKVQTADSDYASRVQMAKAARQDNISRIRPQAIKVLQDLIAECDSALTLQLQRFATYNEKLLVGNGMVVSPMKQDGVQGPRGMREMIQSIDNDRDLFTFITGYSSNIPPKPADIVYEKNSVFLPTSQTPGVSQSRQVSGQAPSQAVSPTISHQQQPGLNSSQGSRNPSANYQQLSNARADRNFSGTSAISQHPPQLAPISSMVNGGYASAPIAAQVPAPVPTPPSTTARAAAQSAYPSQNGTTGSYPVRETTPARDGIAQTPSKPVFGVGLEALFRRDETAVPMVVYQCIQAVDLFGLRIEGIYRLSGNAAHITQLKNVFNQDASRVDFRNPENFNHDVNSVAGLLKQFFRDLPDPLLTTAHYADLIEAARIDDDVLRRDSLHAVINSLPDPNYATLRAVILHLHRVQEHAQFNRMSSSNIAICFAPTLMGQHTGNMKDAGLQARVVDTILQNTYQIFDED